MGIYAQIPYRYGTTEDINEISYANTTFQSLIGTVQPVYNKTKLVSIKEDVSIPHRYGTTFDNADTLAAQYKFQSLIGTVQQQ